MRTAVLVFLPQMSRSKDEDYGHKLALADQIFPDGDAARAAIKIDLEKHFTQENTTLKHVSYSIVDIE